MSAGYHHGLGRDRDSRRHRLHRNLAGGPAAPRCAGNTIWEGPDNLLCLDVRRGIERDQTHQPLLEGLHDAVSASDDETTRVVSCRIDHLEAAITPRATWTARLPRPGCSRSPSSSARSTPGPLLTEQAACERAIRHSDREALVAQLCASRHLADQGPLRGLDTENDDAIERFDESLEGALVIRW